MSYASHWFLMLVRLAHMHAIATHGLELATWLHGRPMQYIQQSGTPKADSSTQTHVKQYAPLLHSTFRFIRASSL